MKNRILIGTALVASLLVCGHNAIADSTVHDYYEKLKLKRSTGDHKETAGRLPTAINSKGLGADIYFHCGTAQERLGDENEAIRNYTTAIRINPQMEAAYNNRGCAYYRLGQHAQAIKDFSRALELNPSYALAYYNRGNAYNGKGDLDRAIEDFTQAIRINPRDSAAYNNRGWTRLKKQEIAESIKDFDIALKISPEYALASHNRRVAELRAGDTQRWKSKADPGSSAVLGFLKEWKSAWEQKDLETYAKLYSSDFRQGDMDYKKFLKSKKNLFQKYRTIRVGTEQIDIKLAKDQVSVKFQQVFQGDDYRDRGWKSMVLARDKVKGFKIVQEEWSPQQVASNNSGI